jgi:regulation of enolase protein 1 (concanavalin A-like superfamily)
MAKAQFVHPGGLHTQADLDRMKTQVAAGAHPWIDDWNLLIADPLAQNTYTAAPMANMGANRQRADQDAHAAYLQAIRWYISGDASYADNAVKILNAWASAVNQVPAGPGTDAYGLVALPIEDFAIAGEVLRIYPGWNPADFATFQAMFTNYLYAAVNDFLTNHNGQCISYYWPSWDAPNLDALIAMGVLNDNQAWFNQGIDYFKKGAGNGRITYAVINPTGSDSSELLGQAIEVGRDQEHAQLAFGAYGYAAQIAWNQGTDIFSYDNYRILAGAEYLAKYALQGQVPYSTHTDCVNDDMLYPSINGLGRLDDRPIWELLYNHYVVKDGVKAPAVTAIANLYRPEVGSNDHLGYGTLTFTLSGTASSYPPNPLPSAPVSLTAIAGVSRVSLSWQSDITANGYVVLRSIDGGGYSTLATLTKTALAQYTDTSVSNGTTYSYEVEAVNQSGTGPASAPASATPQAASSLPDTWQDADVGTVTTPGSAVYSTLGKGTFIVSGQGSGIGGVGGGAGVTNTSTSDSFNFAYAQVTGDFSLTVRMANINGNLSNTGLMMRETLDANATAVSMLLGNLGGRYAQMGLRTTTGGSTNWVTGDLFTYTPVWYRLERKGNVFNAYQSDTAQIWHLVGTVTIPMASTYYVGMVATTGNTAGSSVLTTTFDNVTAVGTINILPPTILIPNGKYVIESAYSGLALDDPGSSMTNGQIMDQSTVTAGANQQWTVTNLGNNVITLTNNASGDVLDVGGASLNPGATVDQWPSNGQTNQEWKVVDVGSASYELISVNSGLALDVIGGTKSSGTQIDQWTYGGNAWQQWTFTNPANIVLPNLPSGWSDTDIDGPGVAGSASYNNGVFTVSGGGYDIWGSYDYFNYLSKSSSGDVTVTARVVTQTVTNDDAKAGVMIRDSNAGNAAYAFVFITPNYGVNFEYRWANGSGTAVGGQILGPPAPYWVRLTRSGNQFTAYASADGTTWTQVGSTITSTMSATPLEGLAVTSRNNSALSTATFDNVTAP